MVQYVESLGESHKNCLFAFPVPGHERTHVKDDGMGRYQNQLGKAASNSNDFGQTLSWEY